MEELLEGLDMAELQKGVMSDPNIRQTVQEVLKNPEALNEFKNFFKGGSKWRNKHKRNRKKRGSGGTHSKAGSPTPFHKHMGKSLKTFPFASSSTTTEKGEKTMERRGGIAHELGDDHFRSLSREIYNIGRLREKADDLKKEILKKDKEAIDAGKKVLYGGKWSLKYKRSINCRNPKGFSQKQYCKKKNRKSKKKRKKSRKKRKRRKKKRTRRKRR